MKKENLAVALKYPENAPAPFITAKGKGKVADYILTQAKGNDVKIVYDSELVDFLCLEDIGALVPENAWKSVAAIFSFIYSQKNENR